VPPLGPVAGCCFGETPDERLPEKKSNYLYHLLRINLLLAFLLGPVPFSAPLHVIFHLPPLLVFGATDHNEIMNESPPKSTTEKPGQTKTYTAELCDKESKIKGCQQFPGSSGRSPASLMKII
jgi:hypothetical protein